jgi:hypothetical protein
MRLWSRPLRWRDMALLVAVACLVAAFWHRGFGVRQAIARSPHHAWAGEYRRGWICTTITVLVAPDAVFAQQREDHCDWLSYLLFGDRHVREGTLVESLDGVLRFRFDDDRGDAKPALAPAYRLVRWGPRRYLVPADDLVGFASAINLGLEPRTEIEGRYLLHNGDERLPVTGLPDLPLPARAAIRNEPLIVHVVATSPLGISDDVSDCEARYRVQLDAGSADGLVTGQELWLQPDAGDGGRPFFFLARIAKVDASRSEAEVLMSVRDCRLESGPLPGWKLTTGARDATAAAQQAVPAR